MSIINCIKQLPYGYTIDKVFIIDNSNIDLSLNARMQNIKEELTQLEIIINQNNLGYGSAHNIAIKQSYSKYHLILNPDVLLAQNNLLEALLIMEKNPDAVALSPFAKDGAGKTLHLTKNYPSIFDLLLRLLPNFLSERLSVERLSNYENRKIVENNKLSNVNLISGCYMLCRRDLLMKAGLFNERFFLYFEDFALSIEINKFGRVIYAPTVKIIHFGGNASRKGLIHICYFIRSMIKFFNFYGWKLW